MSGLHIYRTKERADRSKGASALGLSKRVRLEAGVVLLMLALGGVTATVSSWRSNHIVHVGLESASVAAGAILTALGLLSFMDSGHRRSLIYGTTFLAAGLMDVLHIAPFAREGLSQVPGLAPLTCTGGWYGAKILLGGGMLLGITLKEQTVRPERRWRLILYGPAVAITLALVTAIMIIRYFPLSSAALHASPAGGPIEAIPLILFLAVGISLVQSAGDTVTTFLGRSLLVAAWSQALMVFSSYVNDLPFIAAHGMKVISSGVAVAGILVHYGTLFRLTRKMAEMDPLTGLPNLRHLLNLEQNGLEEPVFLLADVDHFKQINDRHGHRVGDDLLTQVGQRLQSVLDKGSIVARYGGDEFVALFQGRSPEEVMAAAEAARTAVAGQPFHLPCQGESVPVRITMSMGVAATAGQQRTIMELLAAADKAAYKAKALGRNTVVVFSEQLVDEVLLGVAPEHMDRLASVSQVVGRFAQQVAPPLLSVQADLEQIREGRRVTSAQIDKAVSDLRRVDLLIRSMLELSALEPGAPESVGTVTLRRLVDPVITQVRALASGRKAQLQISLAGLESIMTTRPKLLQATLLNLAANGLDALSQIEDRQLSLSLTVVANSVAIEVRDTGSGIPLATLQQIGEPFVTGHFDAVGMGYYSLNQVVAAQGGHAQIYTRRGKGTTVRIHLPLHPKPHKEMPPTRLRAVTKDTFEVTLGEIIDSAAEGLTIGMLAAQSGVSEGSIRAWERRYGIPKPARLPNGYRVYSHQDLQVAIWLKSQVEAGLRIGEAVELLNQNPSVVGTEHGSVH